MFCVATGTCNATYRFVEDLTHSLAVRWPNLHGDTDTQTTTLTPLSSVLLTMKAESFMLALMPSHAQPAVLTGPLLASQCDACDACIPRHAGTS